MKALLEHWPLLLAWLALTYPLHLLIHEGAHWLAFLAFGVRAWIVLVPRIKDGSIQWGRCEVPPDTRMSPQRQVVMCAAPVLAELLWMVLVLSVALRWKWAALEALPALVDVGVWLAGARTGRTLSDGARVRAALQ